MEYDPDKKLYVSLTRADATDGRKIMLAGLKKLEAKARTNKTLLVFLTLEGMASGVDYIGTYTCPVAQFLKREVRGKFNVEGGFNFEGVRVGVGWNETWIEPFHFARLLLTPGVKRFVRWYDGMNFLKYLSQKEGVK